MSISRKLALRFALTLAVAGFAAAVASCSSAGRASSPARPVTPPAQPERKILAQAEPPAPRVQTPPPAHPVDPPRPEPAKIEPPPAPRPVPPTPEQWRPPWWIDAPSRAAGKVTVAARAEAGGLLETRKAAVDAGLAALATALGREAPSAETLRYSVIRLADGRVRGFILMSSPE